MTEASPNLADKITISLVDETHKTILMTFGLLNKLCVYVGTIQDLANIYMQPELQDIILYEVLVERDREGVALHKYELYKFGSNILPDEAEKVLQWCEAHVSNFFMKRLRATQAIQARMIQNLKG